MMSDQPSFQYSARIGLEPKTYDRLNALGKKGDTFDDIINQILDQVEK